MELLSLLECYPGCLLSNATARLEHTTLELILQVAILVGRLLSIKGRLVSCSAKDESNTAFLSPAFQPT